jgi:ribonuclease BN (tRNA processing enzyme)
MKVQVLGCGDAFGSGGRFNTCFHVSASTTNFLIDCGASALIAMRRFGVEPNEIETVFLSHLHGDHFGGLPFLILDAQHVSRRTTPLTIAGPPGLRERLPALMDAMFPGSSAVELRFTLTILELDQETATSVNGITVTPFPVRHPSGGPSYALRLECENKTICYTGDTEWVESLLEAGRDADLLIAEAYSPERNVPYHMHWPTLRSRLPEIAAKRVLLTHLSAAMLSQPLDDYEIAEDGLVVSLQ